MVKKVYKVNFLIILVALIFLFGTVILSGFFIKKQANAQEYWKNHIASAYAGGTGTESDPFKISNPEQLALMASQVNSNINVNKHFELINNISLAGKFWEPIGTNYSFKGKFDGKGHIVSGLNFDKKTKLSAIGFFSFVQGATICNLMVEGVIDFGNEFYDGYAAGIICSGTDVKLSKLASNVTINLKHATRVAGIIGTLKGESTIDECFNLGNITASVFVGGIVGLQWDPIKVTDVLKVTNVYNKGNIKGSIAVSGIAADLSLNRGYDSHIKYAYNYGNIEGREQVTGIADNAAKLEYVYNYGNVTGTKYVAGITGYAGEVSYAVNEGNIKGETYVGGISAWTLGYRTTSFSKCTNYGKVEGTKFVGGITAGGLVYTTHTYKGCGNFGTISGSSYVGGIIGGFEIGEWAGKTGFVKITYSFNEGNITSTGDYIGGIAGSLYPSSYITDGLIKKTIYENGASQLDYVYNTGTINGKNNRGGIAGYLHYEGKDSNVYVKRAYNFGTITDNGSKTYVGALVGRNYKDKIDFSACIYVSGKSKPNKGLGTSGGGGTNYSGTSAKVLADAKNEIAKFSNFTTGSSYPAGGRWSTSLTIYHTSELTSKFSSLIWQTKSGVNDGKPYLKNFYW